MIKYDKIYMIKFQKLLNDDLSIQYNVIIL